MQLSHVSTRSGWRQFVSTVLFAVLGMMLPLRFAQAVDSLQAVDTGGAVGQFTSLVLDGSGFPVVSHYDATNHDLKVVHCNDANCTGNDESIVTVDSAGPGGQLL
ncbi:MAG: hypothetical protein HYZ50_15355 [Deltaproteobacteria bacterium]|nr:hypothetical protein [Deltaproteobacteria bacterium]